MQLSKTNNFFVGLVLFVGTRLLIICTSLIVQQKIVVADDTQDMIVQISAQEYQHMIDGQDQDAIEDLNQIIDLDPNLADAYDERGNMEFVMNDKQAAIADLQTAKDLYTAQGNTGEADRIQDRIDQIEYKTE